MKKLSVLLLSALLIVVSLAFTSCDQQAVDDALNNLMETSVDIFEAVFKKADEHLDEDGEKENAELGNASDDEESLNQEGENQEQASQEQGSVNQDGQDSQEDSSLENDDQITSDTNQDENQ